MEQVNSLSVTLSRISGATFPLSNPNYLVFHPNPYTSQTKKC